MMLRALLYLTVLGTLTGSFLSSAQAQTTCSIPIKLLKIGDTDISTTNMRPVNAAECANGVSVTFQLTSIPTASSLAMWVGDNCSSGTARQMQGTTCVMLGSTMIKTGTRQDVPVALSQTICGSAPLTSNIKMWFIPTNSVTSMEDASACAFIALSVDTQPPTAPTGLNEPSGQRSLEVTWTPTGDTKVNRYIVFIDPNPDGGDADAGVMGPCASSKLVAGDVLDLNDLPSGIKSKYEMGYAASSASVSGSLLTHDMATVAVAAQDLAGNVGPLSEPSCMHKVPTSGYWDVYTANGGTGKSGGCSVSSSGSALWLPLLVLLGLRRRRSRS